MEISIPLVDSNYHELPVANRQRLINNARLSYADTRLVQWGKWARAQYDHLGYPKLSLIYKVLRRRAKRLGTLSRPLDLRLKGLTARGSETRSLQPKVVGMVSPEIEEVDRAVASIESTHREIVRIEYILSEGPVEAKAALMGMYPVEYRATLRRAKLAVADHLS